MGDYQTGLTELAELLSERMTDSQKDAARKRGAARTALHGELREKLEARIMELEAKIAALDEQLCDPDLYRQPQQFNKLQDEREIHCGLEVAAINHDVTFE